MSAHILTTQMQRFCARTLEVAEMVTIAEHLAVCDDCRQLYHDVFQRRRNYAPLVFTLSPEVWLRHEHLENEQLISYIEDKLDEAEREMSDVHLKVCKRCRGDITNLLELREKRSF